MFKSQTASRAARTATQHPTTQHGHSWKSKSPLTFHESASHPPLPPMVRPPSALLRLILSGRHQACSHSTPHNNSMHTPTTLPNPSAATKPAPRLARVPRRTSPAPSAPAPPEWPHPNRGQAHRHQRPHIAPFPNATRRPRCGRQKSKVAGRRCRVQPAVVSGGRRATTRRTTRYYGRYYLFTHAAGP